MELTLIFNKHRNFLHNYINISLKNYFLNWKSFVKCFNRMLTLDLKATYRFLEIYKNKNSLNVSEPK